MASQIGERILQWGDLCGGWGLGLKEESLQGLRVFVGHGEIYAGHGSGVNSSMCADQFSGSEHRQVALHLAVYISPTGILAGTCSPGHPLVLGAPSHAGLCHPLLSAM